MKDAMEFTIEEDGTISIKTDKVSATNHVSADQLLALIRKLAGGEVSTKRRVDIPLIEALHAHTHDGHTHTH
jgi:hypothetical protein